MKKSVHNLFRIPVHKMLDFPNYLHISLVKLLHTKSYSTVSTALKIFLLYHKSPDSAKPPQVFPAAVFFRTALAL